MNEINKDEMFGNFKAFLKAKGVELQEGSYTNRIRKGCDILAESVNLSQRAFERAKDAMDQGLDQLRQTVHEHTAPKDETSGTPPPPPKAASSKSRPSSKPKRRAKA